MIGAKEVLKQINDLIVKLISLGLCEDQKFPSTKEFPGKIEEINPIKNSLILKNIPYEEMYTILLNERAFDIKMIDGALISMSYKFRNKELIAHRLSFFPAPNLEVFQNEPELYLEDEIYSDMIDKRIVTVPIRFDFDNNTDVCKPILHPSSHLTLGQYKNCRIPLSSALTPFQFLSFITMNFYHTAHEIYSNQFPVFKECFEETIFDEEKEILHIYTPTYKKQRT